MKRALEIKPLRDTLRFYLLVMLLTPTFQVYLGDFYDFTNRQDIIAEVVISMTLLFTTIAYVMFLQNFTAFSLALIALVIQICNYGLSVVLMYFGYTEFWIAIIQASLIEYLYRSLLWLPAYV